jgi:membrane fusion protein (multidrug efflux system)
MAKRMIITLGAVVFLIGALAFVKFQQIQAAVAQAASFQPPPTAVTTIVAKKENWSSSLKSIGSVVAVQGVTVSADLPGIVSRISFDSGRQVQVGQILVQLDTRQEQAQLEAVQAQRNLARINYDRMKSLVDAGAIPRADYDKALAD